MANDFLRLSCPYCGGSLCPDGELYRCGDCGNRFEKKRTETDSEKIRSILDEMKAEQVANIRRRLWEETHKEYISSDAILDAAQKILDILPEDRFANFYKAAVSEGYEELNRFLDNFDASNTDDLPLILDFSIKVMEELNINSVKALAERGLTGEAKIDCYSKIEAEAEKIQSGIYNTDVPRTVFLAYSSKDMKKVNEVAAYLESQGFSCFVALRNLRHGKGAKENYQAEIMNAIANCKCVVFISSENSRAMTCDAMRIEIPFLRKTYPDKPHIEFLIEDYGKKTGEVASEILKDYFRNLEYCTTLKDLGVRVLNAEADVNTGATAISKQQEEMMKKLQELEKKTSNQSSSDGVEPMIKRAEAMLTEGDFEGAANVADRILDRDFECAKAYLVKLLAECRVRCLADLGKVCTPLEVNKNYQKAFKYADITMQGRLKKCAVQVNENKENERKKSIYQKQSSALLNAADIDSCQKIIDALQEIRGYKDSIELIKTTKKKMNKLIAEEAEQREKKEAEREKENHKRLIEEAREEAEKQAEELRRVEKEKARKRKTKKIASIVISAVCFIIVAVVVWSTSIAPAIAYGKAVKLMEVGNYKEAIVAFEELDGYKDSEAKITEIINNPKARYYLLKNEGVGDYVYLGSYPQSKVTDEALISTLNSRAGTNGYEFSSNESDNMRYIDISEGNERYRGVYKNSEIYWFKFELLKWRILTKSSGQAMLLCESIIDSQAYQNEINGAFIKGTNTYANNYEESTIRKWLNETFYNTAFSEAEKAFIQTTTVDNSASTTYSSTNRYVCNNTNDQVFLLSYQEVLNRHFAINQSRRASPTDYAKAQGCNASLYNYTEVSDWWLRSPYDFYSDNAFCVHSDGDWGFDHVDKTNFGVRPALWIDLET